MAHVPSEPFLQVVEIAQEALTELEQNGRDRKTEAERRLLVEFLTAAEEIPREPRP